MQHSRIHAPLAEALAARGYDTLTSVQSEVIKEGADDRDLIVSAKTGSGKTVAFGLAIADQLIEGDRVPWSREPLGLVIAPTRELAIQVSKELEWLYASAGARVVTCVGGMDPMKERRALHGGAHIVVGTPGRLRDHLERGALDLSALRVVVLDEADEMLDMGFREELEEILDATPDERRTLLFSATMPRPIVAHGQALPEGRAAHRNHRRARGACGHRLPGGRRLPDRHRACRGQPPAPPRSRNRDPVLRHPRSGSAPARQPDRARLPSRRPVRRAQPERAQQRAAEPARQARARLRRDRCRRPRPRPAVGLARHPRRASARRRGPSAPIGPDRPGRPQGHRGADRPVPPTPGRRNRCFATPASTPNGSTRPRPSRSARRTGSGCWRRSPRRSRPTKTIAQLAQELMSQLSPEAIASALVRSLRTDLPAPEDILASGGREERVDGPRAGFEGSTWFRINAGRRHNADPRWLLPLICRYGHVSRNDIGAIRVAANESYFEVTQRATPGFLKALRRAVIAPEDEGLVIEPAPPRAVPAAQNAKSSLEGPLAPEAQAAHQECGSLSHNDPSAERLALEAPHVAMATNAGANEERNYGQRVQIVRFWVRHANPA